MNSRMRNIVFTGLFVAAVGLAVGYLLPALAPKPDSPPTLHAAPSHTDHVMFGGTVGHNMVNLKDANVPAQLMPVTEKDDDGKDKVVKEADAVQVWKAELGSRAYGGPVISNGKVFVGTNNDNPRNPRDVMKTSDGDKLPIDKGIVMCFRESDGKFLWQAVHDKLPSGQVHDWPKEGVCSTPTVIGDRIYYVSNRCTVVCADVEGLANGNQGIQTERYKDPTDADIIWEYDMMKELNVFPHNMAACSPLIVDDSMHIVTANGVDENHINIPSPDAPSFISLNLKDGSLKWKSNLPGKNIMHGQWSNAAFGEFGGVKTVIFPGGDGWLYGLKPDSGEVIWKFDANPKDSIYKLGGEGTKNDFVGTPVVHDGKIFIGVGQDPEHFTGIGHFYCIDPAGKTGDISPELIDKSERLPDGKFKITGKPNPNSAQVWHYGGADPRPETQRQRDFIYGRTMSTACLIDNICYISELQGKIHCLDIRTGKRFWSHDTLGAIWGSPYYVDGKVFLSVEGGELFVYKHVKEPKTIDEFAITDAASDRDLRNKVKAIRAAVEKEYLIAKMEFDAPVRSTPIVANGIIYIMTENALYALKKKP